MSCGLESGLPKCGRLPTVGPAQYWPSDLAPKPEDVRKTGKLSLLLHPVLSPACACFGDAHDFPHNDSCRKRKKRLKGDHGDVCEEDTSAENKAPLA